MYLFQLNELTPFFCGHLNLTWLVSLKLIQLEQQNAHFPLTILAKKFKTNTLQCHKSYMKIFELEINNFHIQIFEAKIM